MKKRKPSRDSICDACAMNPNCPCCCRNVCIKRIRIAIINIDNYSSCSRYVCIKRSKLAIINVYLILILYHVGVGMYVSNDFELRFLIFSIHDVAVEMYVLNKIIKRELLHHDACSGSLRAYIQTARCFLNR